MRVRVWRTKGTFTFLIMVSLAFLCVCVYAGEDALIMAALDGDLDRLKGSHLRFSAIGIHRDPLPPIAWLHAPVLN